MAKTGGWKDVTTLERCYQQADEVTQLQVFLEAPKLCSTGMEITEATPNTTPLTVASSKEQSRNVKWDK